MFDWAVCQPKLLYDNRKSCFLQGAGHRLDNRKGRRWGAPTVFLRWGAHPLVFSVSTDKSQRGIKKTDQQNDLYNNQIVKKINRLFLPLNARFDKSREKWVRMEWAGFELWVELCAEEKWVVFFRKLSDFHQATIG